MKKSGALKRLAVVAMGGIAMVTTATCDPYNGFTFFRDRGGDDYYYDGYVYYEDYYYDDCFWDCWW